MIRGRCGDAILYEGDVCLFEEGGWLNDRCINYVMERWKERVPGGEMQFLDPTVLSFFLNQCHNGGKPK